VLPVSVPPFFQPSGLTHQRKHPAQITARHSEMASALQKIRIVLESLRGEDPSPSCAAAVRLKRNFCDIQP